MFLLALEPAASFVKDLSSCVSALQITHFITTREFDFKASRYRAMAFLPSLSPSACRSLYGLEYKSGDTEERERERERERKQESRPVDGRTDADGGRAHSCSHLSLFRLQGPFFLAACRRRTNDELANCCSLLRLPSRSLHASFSLSRSAAPPSFFTAEYY